MNTKPATVDEYILSFPKPVQTLLKQVRKTIRENAPDAEEIISYGMAGYKTHKKPLVYFAAFTHHIGLYATPSGHAKFAKKLAKYKQGKGSVQFPLDQPLPLELIGEIVQFKASENALKKK